MCDYDGDNYLVHEREVKIRAKRDCINCEVTFPKGHTMNMWTCRDEYGTGPLNNIFICKTCNILIDETHENTALHICQGGLGDGSYPHSWQRYRYVRQCLEENQPIIMAVLDLIASGFLEEPALA